MRDLKGTIPVRVWDGDTFEGSGGTRLPKPRNVKMSKVKFLKDLCLWLMGVTRGPEANICMLTKENLHLFLPSTGRMEGVLVVDCTDEDLRLRREFKKEVESLGGYWMRGNYDGDGTVVIAEGLPFTKSGVTDGNYSTQPSAAVAMMAGGALATAVLKFTRLLEYTNYQFKVDTGIRIEVPPEGVQDAQGINGNSPVLPNVQDGTSPSQDDSGSNPDTSGSSPAGEG